MQDEKLRELFSELDQDGNGTISKNEVAELAEIFMGVKAKEAGGGDAPELGRPLTVRSLLSPCAARCTADPERGVVPVGPAGRRDQRGNEGA